MFLYIALMDWGARHLTIIVEMGAGHLSMKIAHRAGHLTNFSNTRDFPGSFPRGEGMLAAGNDLYITYQEQDDHG